MNVKVTLFDAIEICNRHASAYAQVADHLGRDLTRDEEGRLLEAVTRMVTNPPPRPARRPPLNLKVIDGGHHRDGSAAA